MYIAQIFSIILLSFGAAAFYLGVSALRRKYRDYLGNLILGLLCVASCIWSYGFGMVFLTNSPQIAYWGRTIGMIGVFLYLLSAQILVGVLVKILKIEYYTFCIYAALGFLLYFPVVSPSMATYYIGEWGMTYTFSAGVVNNLYSIYSVVYAINMTVSIYQMLKYATDKRSKVSGYKMLVSVIIIFVGMVLDTILHQSCLVIQ